MKKDIDYVIDIKDLNKKFFSHASKGNYTSIKSAFLNIFKKSSKPKTAFEIKDLTLRIPKGSSVGVIGRNGSGKSTLLKLITGIYAPDSGDVKIKGRVSALIELGAGFHPDFTGRENLYLSGIIQGMTKSEINKKFDSIVEFAELEEVIDLPVKTYSSGMYMRLGFSLAVHTEPDILLVDEVLAVGDAAFVSKCKERISELKKNGTTLLMVTHDLDAVLRWSDEVLWLNNGRVRDRGYPQRVVDHYLQYLEKQEKDQLEKGKSNNRELLDDGESKDKEVERWGSREVEISKVNLLVNDESALLLHTHDNIKVEIDYTVNEKYEDVAFGVAVTRADGLSVFGTNTELDSIKLDELQSKGKVIFEIKDLNLLEGKYSIDVAVHREDGYPYDYHKGVLDFSVKTEKKHVGVISYNTNWELVSNG